MDQILTLKNGMYRLTIDPPMALDAVFQTDDDKNNVDCFTKVAERLDARFTSLCKLPFLVAFYEYKCGEDDPHSYAQIITTNAAGEDGIAEATSEKPMTYIKGRQYYAARHKTDPDQNYMGYIEVEVFMYCPEKKWEKNPAVDTLLDLAFAQYHTQIEAWFKEWGTDYRNGYEVCEEDIIQH